MRECIKIVNCQRERGQNVDYLQTTRVTSCRLLYQFWCGGYRYRDVGEYHDKRGAEIQDSGKSFSASRLHSMVHSHDGLLRRDCWFTNFDSVPICVDEGALCLRRTFVRPSSILTNRPDYVTCLMRRLGIEGAAGTDAPRPPGCGTGFSLMSTARRVLFCGGTANRSCLSLGTAPKSPGGDPGTGEVGTRYLRSEQLAHYLL